MATEKRLISYYVVRNKNTGFYFRGKGENRWCEYFNQASIYRMKAHAENTANWLNLRGEPVEIVPIKIVEHPTADSVEVVLCDYCVKHGGCYTEDVFRLARIEKPYCCAGKRDGDGNA